MAGRGPVVYPTHIGDTVTFRFNKTRKIQDEQVQEAVTTLVQAGILPASAKVAATPTQIIILVTRARRATAQEWVKTVKPLASVIYVMNLAIKSKSPIQDEKLVEYVLQYDYDA